MNYKDSVQLRYPYTRFVSFKTINFDIYDDPSEVCDFIFKWHVNRNSADAPLRQMKVFFIIIFFMIFYDEKSGIPPSVHSQRFPWTFC